MMRHALAALLALALSMPATTARAAACPAELTASFDALIALELGAGAGEHGEIALSCAGDSARVRVTRGAIVRERSVPLSTPDAARWLALAAAELVRGWDEPLERVEPPPATPLREPIYAREAWLHASARARLGDDPHALRLGGELGLMLTFRSRWGFDTSARASTGQRTVGGAVHVRASDLALLASVHRVFSWHALTFWPALGVSAGATQLDATTRSTTLATSELWRAFVGPVARATVSVAVQRRFRVELGLEASYFVPRIEGRRADGHVLYAQTPWSLAASLGFAFRPAFGER